MTDNSNKDTMDFVWRQCWKLSSTIIISNELADNRSSFMQYSEAERLQLAEQFAQAKQSLDEASVRLHEISIAKSLRDD